MDGHRFDKMMRALAEPRSRRSILRSLAGGAAGGVLALFSVGAATADTCRPPGHRCAQNGNCCSGLCDLGNPDRSKRSKCACPPGTENCNGVCKTSANYQRDPQNCGACGNVCAWDCVGGACCGDAGDPCCHGTICYTAGTTCLGGTCEVCGGLDQPCCEGRCYTAGTICLEGTCEACGGKDLPCCNFDTCYESVTVCSGGTCQECGDAGEPCCGGTICVGTACVGGICQQAD